MIFFFKVWVLTACNYNQQNNTHIYIHVPIMPMTHDLTKYRMLQVEMEYRVMCHTIRFLSYEVGWSWMEHVQIHMM